MLASYIWLEGSCLTSTNKMSDIRVIWFNSGTNAHIDTHTIKV